MTPQEGDGGEERARDRRICGCESKASGGSCLSRAPEIVGCHTAAGAEARWEAGWERYSFRVLLLPEEAALKS